jgi:hypothetical protein
MRSRNFLILYLALQVTARFSCQLMRSAFYALLKIQRTHDLLPTVLQGPRSRVHFQSIRFLVRNQLVLHHFCRKLRGAGR